MLSLPPTTDSRPARVYKTNGNLDPAVRELIIKHVSKELYITIGDFHPTKKFLLENIHGKRITESLKVLLNYLLDHPNEINMRLGDYASPGHFAILHDAARLYKILSLFPGFYKELGDDLGNTHLHLAAYRANSEIVNHILALKGNKTLINHDQETPLDYLCKYGELKSPLRPFILKKLHQ